MKVHRKLLSVVILILSSNMKLFLNGAPSEGIVINRDLTGQELMDMGRVMDKPLLSLLGATFEKTEQKLNKKLTEKIGATEKKLQDGIDKLKMDTSKERDVLKTELCKVTYCEAWTEWSSCSANYLKTFGARTRSRKCGTTRSICPNESSERNETDFQVCQGKTCQHTLTNNNFCIKMYNGVKKTQKDAQDDCHKDGGHLMNIDSALKAKDIEDYFKSISSIAAVWIDGRRTLPNGDWIYEYGSNDTTFSIWGSGEPGSKDDCKLFLWYMGKWSWWGRSCKDTYNYICEIV